MNIFSDAITDVISALASLADGDLGLSFLALAAAGTITMAAIQILKEITPYRRKVQHSLFVRWQNERKAAVDETKMVENISALINVSNVCATKTLREIAELSAGNAENALFSLQIEDMVTQIKLAIPVAIDEASRYPSTLLTLSLGASAADLDLILRGQPRNGSPQEYFDARARITRRMERTLDGIGFSIADRWRLRMQLISLAVTTIFIILVMISNGAGFTVILMSVPIGIVGGYFAPITRDLLAALQKLR